MTVKTSISLTDAQQAFARHLVECGRYPSLSAVLQRGLDMLRIETEREEAEAAALRSLLIDRANGPFISLDVLWEGVEREIAAEMADDDA